ncbi:hypothetical protein EMCRGX_G027015 [Ephydatia muelleri]|eukprot:Em0014g79a
MATDEQTEVSGEHVLQFVPFVSTLEAGFWHELTQRKLNEYHLSEERRKVHGYYTSSDAPGLPTNLILAYNAFSPEGERPPPHGYLSPGTIFNTNTLETFSGTDKNKIRDEEAAKIQEDIASGAALITPNLLSRFFLLTYADLKKYNYYYWFLFPAIVPVHSITYEKLATVEAAWSPAQVINLESAFDVFKSAHPGVGFFLVHIDKEEIKLHSLSELSNMWRPGDRLTVGFCDPSTLDLHPGWPLRNFLALVGWQWGEQVGHKVDVLCYRDCTTRGKRSVGHSLYLGGVALPPRGGENKAVGWEKNEKGKLAPKLVNLSASMDPKKLAESAVDLNLKLMRWRLLPSLDLTSISETKCLLLGAGTLGCSVARCLMGWGVRHITFVDNSSVSFSNPVRQSLFAFSDCLEGGKRKALAAAESLKCIFPGMVTSGVELNIPMPGHAVGTSAKAIDQTKKTVELLEELVLSHDAVFLLMDTRESRWLPTMLCAFHSKLCINAALGFDTFMVMRHGYRPPAGSTLPASDTKTKHTKLPGNELGCYFCSDVVAPTNSTRDRTLDQQCTVTRPGVSMMAGALASELLVSLVQHPWRGLAPADCSGEEDDDPDTTCCLGLVPHQIRGFLSRFQNVLPASKSFDKCTACSETVLQHYKKEGFDFLLKVFDTPNFLEELTGLDKLHASVEDGQVWELSDSDDFEIA